LTIQPVETAAMIFPGNTGSCNEVIAGLDMIPEFQKEIYGKN